MERVKRAENLAITVYGILVILYGIFDVLLKVLPDARVDALQSTAGWINYFFSSTAITLYFTPLNFAIGFLIIRRHYLARYGVIAAMLTFPLIVLNQSMWWGTQSFETSQTAIQLAVVALTLVYFSRRQVKFLFDGEHKFKLISWYGLVVGCIFLIPLLALLGTLYYKANGVWRYDEPFIMPSPQVVSLTRQAESKVSSAYRKVELLNMKLLLPKDFVIWNIRQPDNRRAGWRVALLSPEKNKGLIMLGNSYPFAGEMYDILSKATKITSKFELEKFLLTNNWNPGITLLRTLKSDMGEEYTIKEIHVDDVRGFLRTWQRGKRLFGEFSLYSGDEAEHAGGTISLDREAFGEEDIIDIISSFKFLEPVQHPAEDYYNRGMEYYSANQFMDAEFEFAKAYYQSPENPEYIYMLAESMSKSGTSSFSHIKELLEKALALNPDHEKAKQLLIDIESELSKDKQ